ncbi:MAG: ABC transporter permease [Chloroflexi bacterium]|nr:ABC transporter permease [Chloroflexota bacterium]
MAQSTALSETLFSAGEIGGRQRSLWGMAFQRLIRNKLAMLGLIVVGLMIGAWLASPLIRRYDPAQYQNYNALNQGPSRAHFFGTDNLGRDNWSRVLGGIGLSLKVGLGVAVAVFIIGALVGGLAALGGKHTDNLLMRFTDITYAFPDLLLIILVQAVFRDRKFPPPVLQVVFAISVVAWVTVARLIRGQMLSLKERDYVQAARALGASEARVVFQHLLPNTLSPVIVAITFAVPAAIFAEAALSFIGVGLPPPATSLGRLVSDGRAYVQANISVILFPAAAIALLMLCFTFIGDGLRDALDPRTR